MWGRDFLHGCRKVTGSGSDRSAHIESMNTQPTSHELPGSDTAAVRQPTDSEISRANTMGTSSAFLGLASIATFLFGLGLVLGPWAVVTGRDAIKLDPGAPNARAGIAQGVLGFLLSSATVGQLIWTLVTQ